MTGGAYTKVPKWVSQAFIRGDLKPREARVVAYVVEVTRGFNRQVAPVTPAKVAEATGLRENHVRETLRSLFAAGWLFASDDGVGVPEFHPKGEASEIPKQDQPGSQNRIKADPKTGSFRSQIGINSIPKQDLFDPKTGSETGLNAANDAGPGNAKKTLKKTLKETLEEKTPAPPREDAPSREPLPFEEGDPCPEPHPDDLPADDVGETFGSVAFKAFWDAYPATDRKKSKAKAWEAWQRYRLKPAQVARLMAALDVDKASASWAEGDGKFIPGPWPWLNKKRWLDDAPTLARVVPKAAAQAEPAKNPTDKYAW